MAQDRRSFLKTAGVGAAIASAAPFALAGPGAVLGGVQEAAAAAQPVRTAAAGRFALQLGSDVTDILVGYSGGFPYGKVATFYDGGAPDLPNSLISGVDYEDIVIEVGAQWSSQLRVWVQEMLAGNATHKNGAIISADFNYDIQSSLDFSNALISEVTFPAADAASKDPVTLRIVISPEQTSYKPGKGTLAVPAKQKQKLWLASNFRLTIPDLPTSRVHKIEAFSVKQQIIEARDGGGGPTAKVPGKLEFPNLVPTFPQSDSQPWLDYFEDFVLDGNPGEKKGTLEYLAPDLGSSLLTVEFHNLGIFKCAPDRAEGSSDAIQRFTSEMYMEGISLPAVQ